MEKKLETIFFLSRLGLRLVDEEMKEKGKDANIIRFFYEKPLIVRSHKLCIALKLHS